MAKKHCFVIAPIGEAASETRRRSDQVLKHVIAPAVEACGYEKPVRADHIAEPGMITSQIIQHVVEDELVIADLTDRNPNVFYELAIRHALRKPFVQLMRRGDQIPFDVAGARTVFVDHKDLDSVEAAKEEIIGQIKALEKDPTKLETPISVSLDLQLLKQSDNPEERSMADVLTSLGELRSSVAAVQKKLDDPEALLPPSYLNHMLRRTRGGPLPSVFIRDLFLLLEEIRNPKGPRSEKESLAMHERLEQMCDFLKHRAIDPDLF